MERTDNLSGGDDRDPGIAQPVAEIADAPCRELRQLDSADAAVELLETGRARLTLMALRIAAYIIVDVTVHGRVVPAGHALAALLAALTVFKKALSGVLDRDFRGFAAEGTGPHRALGGVLKGVSLFAALELPPLAMPVRIDEVDNPSNSECAASALAGPFADRHEISSESSLAPGIQAFTTGEDRLPIVPDGSVRARLDSIQTRCIAQTDFVRTKVFLLMANAAQLVRLLSKVTGEPLPTVSDQDRKLVKAGLRTLRGRGWNAGRMTTLDAARLLTAVLASRQSNKAAETVELYAQTRPDTRRSSEGLYAVTGIDELVGLAKRHSFVDAVNALISSAGNGSLRRLNLEKDGSPVPRIEVYAFAGAAYGRVRISGLANGLTANVEYVLTDDKGASSAARTRQSGDLEQSRRITERTILSLGNLIAEDKGDEQQRT
jgi:hypothetical protein